MKSFRTILLILVSMAMINGCSSIRYIPTETKEIINYIDSTIVHRDTVEIEIPREVLKEIVYADSSYLETSVAESMAMVDSLGYLHHSLNNKQTKLGKEVVYVDRVVYRDTTITKEIPVPVEVPKKYVPKFYQDCTWGFFILIGLLIAFVVGKLYFRKRL